MDKGILFFSKGRGYGHAIPDIAIAEEMTRIDAGIRIEFVSYATGEKVFRKYGLPVIDLGQPEANAFVPTLVAAYQAIRRAAPTLVVAHEEFGAIAAARMANVSSTFISAWLPRAGTPASEALVYASSVIVIEDAGIFPPPPGVVRPYYVGPIYRKLKYGREDRDAIRKEMNLGRESVVMVVIPGGAASEEDCPIVDAVLDAFARLASKDKHLFWISQKDSRAILRRTACLERITVVDFFDPIERMMAVADVVITKGTRGVTRDAAAVGVPSISLSPMSNPIDDMLVPRINNNVHLNARAVDGDILHGYVENALKCKFAPRVERSGSNSAVRNAAERIVRDFRHALESSASVRNECS